MLFSKNVYVLHYYSWLAVSSKACVGVENVPPSIMLSGWLEADSQCVYIGVTWQVFWAICALLLVYMYKCCFFMSQVSVQVFTLLLGLADTPMGVTGHPRPKLSSKLPSLPEMENSPSGYTGS